MSRYRFEKVPVLSSDWDSSQIIYEFDGTDLTDMLEAFDSFLKGCGFNFDGEVTISDSDVTNLDHK